MKTEPTKAKKYLINKEWVTPCFEDGFESEQYVINDSVAEVAINIAFREGQSNPKIRQLEWDFHGLYYQAQMPIACYVIYPSYTDDHLCVLDINDIAVKFNITLNEAKEAAQLDFEERILKCLEIML